jgi:hypothetical protein
MTVRNAKIGELTPDERNANRGTERGRYMLDHSLRQYGAGRSILVDRNGKVIAGNKTIEAAADIGLDDVIVVQTDGSQLVAVQRTDLDLDDGDRARLLAYADNRASEGGLEWDAEQIAADLGEGLDLSALFRDDELPSLTMDAETSPVLDGLDVPDALFPSDNDWGIPTLKLDRQARAVHMPVALWGALGRKKRMPGTWVFYCEDYRFEAIWDHPEAVINTQCRAAVEPNFTTTAQQPLAVSLYQIYRKRWVARLWQEYGVEVFVDLNVTARCREMNLWGVPAGWRAYATRGYSEQLEAADAEFAIAREHAGTDDVLFLYYGGGKACERHAQERGWVYVPEHMNVKAGGVVDG